MAKEGMEFLAYSRVPDYGEVVYLDGELAVTITPVFDDAWVRVATFGDLGGIPVLAEYTGPTTRVAITSPRLSWVTDLEELRSVRGE